MTSDDMAITMPTTTVPVDYWDLDTLLDWVWQQSPANRLPEQIAGEVKRLQEALNERSFEIYGPEDGK